MLAVIVDLPEMHIPPWYWFSMHSHRVQVGLLIGSQYGNQVQPRFVQEEPVRRANNNLRAELIRVPKDVRKVLVEVRACQYLSNCLVDFA